jgi:hypothetical protein
MGQPVTKPTYEFFLTKRYRWVISISTGVFTYVFLLAFLPFGVSNYNPNHRYNLVFLTEMAKFMVLTIALSLLCEFVIKPKLVKRATASSIIGWSVLMLVVLGLGNYLLYNWLGNWHDFGWKSAAVFVLEVSSIFVFPFLGVFFYFRYRMLNERIRQMAFQREVAATPTELIHFTGQGKTDTFSVSSSDFRYAQAQDNYVALFYLKNGLLQKELIRSTLSELLANTNWDQLIRCHRSYAISLQQVHSISGGTPLRLFLKDVPDPIKVSRTYRSAVVDHLRQAAPPNRNSVHPK